MPQQEEEPNTGTAGLLQLSRWVAKTLVGLIISHTEVNYHRHNTVRTANLVCLLYGMEDETTTYILCSCETLVEHNKTNSRDRLHRGALL